MNKTRSIIEKRLREVDNLDPKDLDHDGKASSFEILYDKIHTKIEKKPLGKRISLYKALLSSLLMPLAGAGANKAKLTALSREFLREFEKHVKG